MYSPCCSEAHPEISQGYCDVNHGLFVALGTFPVLIGEVVSIYFRFFSRPEFKSIADAATEMIWVNTQSS